MDPVSAAAEIYAISLDSLMAHTIRATQNFFRASLLELDLVIRVDRVRAVFKKESRVWGVLEAALRTQRESATAGKPGKVDARIYINPGASKQLARFTIAHEIYHLLLQLKHWETQKGSWTRIDVTNEIETQCNSFAQTLCYLHDKLYRDKASRQKYVNFHKDFFRHPIVVGPDGSVNLPKSVLAQESPPFWQETKRDFKEVKFPWLATETEKSPETPQAADRT